LPFKRRTAKNELHRTGCPYPVAGIDKMLTAYDKTIDQILKSGYLKNK